MKPHFLAPLLSKDSRNYILRNERTGHAVAARLEMAFDSAARRKGLLGRTGLDEGSALIIAPCNAVHTFFMRFTIDVAFVNRQGRVVRGSRQIRPWGIGVGLGAWAAIELPAGTLASSETRAGDWFVLEPSSTTSDSKSL